MCKKIEGIGKSIGICWVSIEGRSWGRMQKVIRKCGEEYYNAEMYWGNIINVGICWEDDGRMLGLCLKMLENAVVSGAPVKNP